MTKKRMISKSELDLWRRATADVRPLADLPSGETSAAQKPKAEPAQAKNGQIFPMTSKAQRGSNAGPRTAKPLDPTRPIDIDRRNWARLRRGQIDIERTLDLHGRTQTEAHGALNRFLTMASAAGLRCVLVVTGKGGSEGRGVLRNMVPRWLSEPTHRHHVLTYCPAQPRHGGDGALYVLLRRKRPLGKQ